MKKTLFFLCLWLGLSVCAWAQNQIKQYEYWFDDNNAAKITVAISPSSTYSMSTNIPTNSLPIGLHTFQIRFQDNTGAWSATTNQFFVKPPTIPTGSSQAKMVKYEYWFDNDNANKITETVAAANELSLVKSISNAALPVGLHTFQIRFQDNTGAWSATTNQFFVKPSVLVNSLASNKITTYRYWYDTGFDRQTTVVVDPVNPLILKDKIIPVTATRKATPNDYVFTPNPTGTSSILYKAPSILHTQFKDSIGQWSAVTNDTVRFLYTVNVTCDTLLPNVAKIKNLPKTDSIHFCL